MKGTLAERGLATTLSLNKGAKGGEVTLTNTSNRINDFESSSIAVARVVNEHNAVLSSGTVAGDSLGLRSLRPGFSVKLPFEVLKDQCNGETPLPHGNYLVAVLLEIPGEQGYFISSVVPAAF